jgi:holo-[acyl-carrier protein] synthase
VIYGIGTDIVQIARVEASLARNQRFAEKILGPEEFAVFGTRSAESAARGLRYLATRFAAKEALSKALGTGFRAPMSWHTAQLLNADNGKPYVACSGELGKFMTDNRLSAQVTLSDEADYGVAFVIVTQQA